MSIKIKILIIIISIIVYSFAVAYLDDYLAQRRLKQKWRRKTQISVKLKDVMITYILNFIIMEFAEKIGFPTVMADLT